MHPDNQRGELSGRFADDRADLPPHLDWDALGPKIVPPRKRRRRPFWVWWLLGAGAGALLLVVGSRVFPLTLPAEVEMASAVTTSPGAGAALPAAPASATAPTNAAAPTIAAAPTTEPMLVGATTANSPTIPTSPSAGNRTERPPVVLIERVEVATPEGALTRLSGSSAVRPLPLFDQTIRRVAPLELPTAPGEISIASSPAVTPLLDHEVQLLPAFDPSLPDTLAIRTSAPPDRDDQVTPVPSADSIDTTSIEARLETNRLALRGGTNLQLGGISGDTTLSNRPAPALNLTYHRKLGKRSLLTLGVRYAERVQRSDLVTSRIDLVFRPGSADTIIRNTITNEETVITTDSVRALLSRQARTHETLRQVGLVVAVDWQFASVGPLRMEAGFGAFPSLVIDREGYLARGFDERLISEEATFSFSGVTHLRLWLPLGKRWGLEGEAALIQPFGARAGPRRGALSLGVSRRW